MRTTRPVRHVRTIDDIAAIEAMPYDDLVAARNLYDLFQATAATGGERPALTVLGDGGATRSHRDLLADITRAANLFRALGIHPQGGSVAFLVPTLAALPATLLGAQVAGVAGTLNYLLTAEAIFDLLNAQRAEILVVPDPSADEACWAKAEGARARVPTLRHILVMGGSGPVPDGHLRLDDALAGHAGDTLTFAPADRDAVCALFHTGGTTGRPKLVQLTHGNQIHAAFGFGQVYGYDDQDVVINGFPFFHVGGTITTGLAVLAAGGHVVVPSPYGLRPPAVIRDYWQVVQRHRATVVTGVPTSIAAITHAWTPGTDISSVRMAGTGGAVLPPAVGARFEATTGIRLYETYGMTETAAAIAFNPGRGEPVAGSVGFRAPFSETRIVTLDRERRPCAPGEAGLVQVRGPQVFPGYLDPAHNAGVLDGDGWLTTGDVGYLTDDARLVLTGREKDLIVRSGHNIDPAAIEDVANRFPGVQISAAVGMPDQHAGEVPALFVVPQPGMVIDLDAVKRFVEGNVHEPPARPRSIMLIDALPVTAVGKVFKPALRDLAIREKVRLEVAAIGGPALSAEVAVADDGRRGTLVTVVLSGATDAQRDALALALRPLPQTYRIRQADAVLLDIADGVATLTLNRPDQMNALSRDVMHGLDAHLARLEAMAGLRVVIVTGAGRAFSAGGDLIEFEGALTEDPAILLGDLTFNQQVLTRLARLPVPVIAAVNGATVAGGLELALGCDLIVAAAGARIGDGHAKYGIVPAGGSTVRLMERLGPSRARELLYTARLVTAETLEAWGLVNAVVPAAELMDRARALAREICGASPEVVRHIKALTTSDAGRDDRLRAELDRFADHVHGADLAEGLAAFREKRRPGFSRG